ncbi:hypothetical protein DER44DRAFT_874849 [Fusarium oxysporum]|nr:hypothetical protein DER44DRAFT_874849 [Fusarium oxysporum]
MLANYVHDATDLQKMKCSTSHNHVIPLVPPVSLFFSLSMVQGPLDWQTRDDVCISKSIIRKPGKLLAPLSHNLEMRSTIRAEVSLALVSDVNFALSNMSLYLKYIVIYKVFIPRRTPIKTTIAIAYATKTIKTEVTQETYSTKNISKVIRTQVKDNIIATRTKTEAIDPLQTISLIAHGSGDPDLASIGGASLIHLENQVSTRKYFLDFTANINSDLTFALTNTQEKLKSSTDLEVQTETPLTLI